MSFLSPPNPAPVAMPTPSPTATAPAAPVGQKPQAKSSQPTMLGAIAPNQQDLGPKTLLG